MKLTGSDLIRWAGVAAMVAGICYVIVGMFHQPNILSSVTTTRWIIVHALAIAMSFFGLFGLTGLYARQVEEAGWLGLAGYLLFSLWLALIIPFTFALAFVALVGDHWLRHPKLIPAIVFGVITVLAPFSLMQPSFGLGSAASKAPNPTQARVRSLMNHTAFGIGLYLFALLVKGLLQT